MLKEIIIFNSAISPTHFRPSGAKDGRFSAPASPVMQDGQDRVQPRVHTRRYPTANTISHG